MKESEALPGTRLTTMDALGRNRARDARWGGSEGAGTRDRVGEVIRASSWMGKRRRSIIDSGARRSKKCG